MYECMVTKLQVVYCITCRDITGQDILKVDARYKGSALIIAALDQVHSSKTNFISKFWLTVYVYVLILLCRASMSTQNYPG